MKVLIMTDNDELVADFRVTKKEANAIEVLLDRL